MKRRAAFALRAALAMFVALWLGGRAAADGPDQQQPGNGNVPLAVTVPWKISYQGRLTDAGGNPLNGNYQVVLELWTAQFGGDMLDSTTQMVSVENGLFSTWFSVNPYACFKGQARWLSIAVEGQPVAPRQELLAVPYAWCALGGLGFPFDGSSDDSSGPAFSITSTASSIAIRGLATNTGDVINYGGYFEAYGTQGRAVAGAVSGDNARGVYGYAVSGAASIGVYGESTYGPGGFFTSQNDHLDLTLGGAVGRINTDPADQNSVLYLSSNHDVVVKLDNDGGENSVFRVQNSGGKDVLTVEETGTLTVRSGSSGAILAQVGEGLDYAEGFDVSDRSNIALGTVLVIDPDSPGRLAVSNEPYDRKVAGIVAGAKGLKSGVRLGVCESDCDVALAGRVYCNVDATDGEVIPGDLLTTSPTAGHAMAVKDYPKAQGAILGKAMQGLPKGQKGQILVLVTLQ